MTQIHLLPSWNAPWAVLSALAHVADSPQPAHHVVAWCDGTGRRLLDRPGVSTATLGKRWPWDPLALWRWWRLLARRPGQVVHLWGGLSQGGAATLVAAAGRTVLHVLDAEDLETAFRLEQRGTSAPARIELSRPWYDWAAQRFSRWRSCLHEASSGTGWVAEVPWHEPLLSPTEKQRLEQLLAGEGPLVLGYDGGHDPEAIKLLLWAADILCTTAASLQFCFTSPCPPPAGAIRFWATLRTRDRICWLPWSGVLGSVLPKATLLWWNDPADLTLLLPRKALLQRLPVAGWPATLQGLQREFPGQIARVEKDPYSLASVSLLLLQQGGPSIPPGTLVQLEPGHLP